MVWNIFGVTGVTVTIALLGAGVWVWAVVVRNAYTAFLSARASSASVVLKSASARIAAGVPSAFGDAAHAVHPNEVN